ncbi:hypothetical protein HJC23_013376 [Cyclotella cryptica]|uniref:Uncharacterized protein n=1 Tax=Cyclotella cryptica TaxID=29204 RepID=A0ABD3NDV4_9STRA|eukprot:CCRYP_021193-RA/>CCRYP_021193-RA protein AED:0.41 eAED:0.41 QI:0/-1/0/1/-1/1/1/0/269
MSNRSIAVFFVAVASLLALKRVLLQQPMDNRDAVYIVDAVVTRHQDPSECFHAKKHNITKHRYGLLPKPFINLGMPKMGSSSLQTFFTCGDYNSSHYECGKELCADCMKRAVSNSNSPLSSCGGFDAFVQMDDGSFFPQIEYLNEIHEESPNATFLLTFRGMDGWYRSISHWPPNADTTNPPLVMSNRMKRANITGLPSGVGNNVNEFSQWFCSHVNNVRDFVKRHPSHALIEIDIEDRNVGERLGKFFGIRDACWGHANKNPGLSGRN